MRAILTAIAIATISLTGGLSEAPARQGKGQGNGPPPGRPAPQPARPAPQPVRPAPQPSRPMPTFQRPTAVPSYRPTNPAPPRPTPQFNRPAPVPSVRPNVVPPRPNPNVRPGGMFNPGVNPVPPRPGIPPVASTPRPTAPSVRPNPRPGQPTTVFRPPNTGTGPGSTRPPWFNVPLDRNWPQNRNAINDRRWDQWRHDGNWNDFARQRATIVRNSFATQYQTNRYGQFFTPDWYRNSWQHGYFWNYRAPTPWYWWTYSTVPLINNWLAWNAVSPLYYNYGDNFVYNNGLVYYNQQPLGQFDDYISQSTQLAQSGAQALTGATNLEWMPLGVFALTQTDQAEPTMFLQLAVTKNGLIGGTYRNAATNETQTVSGRVDQKSQRAAWIVGDNSSFVMEAGIFNLSQDQASVLLHWGSDQTQTWLLTRVPAPQQ